MTCCSRSVVMALLVALVSTYSHAQQPALDPFVSRITAVPENGAVRVSWHDVEGAHGAYFVYRSRSEITDATLASAELVATVRAEVQTHVDSPPSGVPHYYAVLAARSDGKPYDILIPFRNKTTRAVAARAVEGDVTRDIVVEGLRAEVEGDSIGLRFDATPSGGSVDIYRSIDPIVDASDLEDALLLGSVEAGRGEFPDRPPAGVPYYYGAVPADADASERPLVTAGRNALASPVEVPLAAAAAAPESRYESRPKPLPFLMLTTTVDTGRALAPAPAKTTNGVVSPHAAEAVDSLLSGRRPAPRPSPAATILAEDRDTSGGTELSLLRAIVSEEFAEGRWSEAKTKLDGFLAVRRSAQTAARARFYLAQCRYFLGDRRGAFLGFLAAEDHFYARVQPWLDRLFREFAASPVD